MMMDVLHIFNIFMRPTSLHLSTLAPTHGRRDPRSPGGDGPGAAQQGDLSLPASVAENAWTWRHTREIVQSLLHNSLSFNFVTNKYRMKTGAEKI